MGPQRYFMIHLEVDGAFCDGQIRLETTLCGFSAFSASLRLMTAARADAQIIW